MSKIKTIDMKKLINGLGINKGDIVVVDNICLICNDKYDLVRIDNSYNSAIPNIIVGMVSGKHSYKIYQMQCEVLSETAQAALKQTKDIKKYKNCKPVVVGK